MIRRFNFKGKQKLQRKRINLDFNWNEEKIESLDISINKEGLEMPEETRIFVESDFKGQYERFDLGKFSEFNGTQNLELKSTGYTEDITVKVLLVNDEHIILREAPNLKPESGDDKEALLPVVPQDLGQKIWRLDFDGERPVLEINQKVPDMEGIASSDERFILSVYPAVIREILMRIIYVEDYEEFDEKEDSWQTKWLIFAEENHPEGNVPDNLNPGDSVSDDEFSQWIDDVVEGFCNSRRKEWRGLIEVPEQ